MRILFVTDKYYPKALANAVCAQSIAKVFADSGDQVDMIVYQDSGYTAPQEYEGVRIHTIKPDWRFQLFYYSRNFPEARLSKLAAKTASLMSKSKKMLLLPWQPLYSFSFPKRILDKMELLNSENKYDIVISVFASFENALSGMWFKQRNPECKWCLYTLDTFINHRQTWLPEKWRRAGFWLPRFLNTTDLFIYMKSREHEYEDARFDRWRYKMKPADIPLLEEKKIESETRNDSECETWVYAGSLGKPHYDITEAINCFLALPETRKRVLVFYTSGEASEEVKQYEESSGGRVVCAGYIEHDKLIGVYKEADVLFSVKTSDQISAKIFEYMNYGKRIVHFSGCKEDPNQVYVEKYPKGIVIKTYCDENAACSEKLNAWLNCSDIDNMILKDLSGFMMNTPTYTKNLIKDTLFGS